MDMNYIKQLEATVREQRAEIEALHRNITGLRVYVCSNKFFCGDSLDGYVSCSDVARRLTEVQTTEA
jgi:hypothetical protein